MSQDPNQSPSQYETNPYQNLQQPAAPYIPPSQPGPYGVPPTNYGYQSQYNYDQYGQYILEAQPLSLSDAIQRLPQQYLKATTQPSALTFAMEKGKAKWDIVWVQLIGYAVISAILSYLHTLAFPVATNLNALSKYNPQLAQALQSSISGGVSFSLIIFIPLGFFIDQGILYLLAKAFRGQGSFLQQSYNVLLFTVPLGIIGSLLNFIPILGSLISTALGIYGIVLQIFSIMGVHRLSGGKASAVVFIPLGVALVLLCALVVIAIFVVIAALSHH